MTAGIPVAFLQLAKHPRRLFIATAGIALSALGILCQMGFEDSLFRSATRLFQEFDAELVVISPQYQFMVLPEQFSERRLYQAAAVPGVRSFSPVRLGVAPFKNPLSKIVRNVYVVGIPRGGGVFANPEWERQARNLRDPDEVLFDSRSRPEFGPIRQLFAAGPVHTEISNQRVRVTGLFEMGASFSADGTVITTDEGFGRLFPSRGARMVDIGLIHLQAGAVAAQVGADLRRTLARDVVVLTHDELNEREQAYWRGTTPAGFIFKTVLIVSLIVGCVSVYQILSSDVAQNLHQYATLKAIGYPDSYFVHLTLEKAWLLTSIAYPVGFLLTTIIYFCATHLTLVPLVMTTMRAVGVYVLMLATAAGAGMLAMSRLRRCDFSELL